MKIELRLDPSETNAFMSPAMRAGRDIDSYVLGIEEGLGYEEEGFADQDPNLLVVHVRKARDLVPLDINLQGNDSSDPYVKVTCDGVEHR